MDRGKKDELPRMQVDFIDSICLPVYKVSQPHHTTEYYCYHVNQAFAKISSPLTALLEGVENNRRNWSLQQQANSNNGH